MTEKVFINKRESVINTVTDELVNASSVEAAEILVLWLNRLLEERRVYKELWEEMSYYFTDDMTLNDLDHKDFHSLQRLSKGLID